VLVSVEVRTSLPIPVSSGSLVPLGGKSCEAVGDNDGAIDAVGKPSGVDGGGVTAVSESAGASLSKGVGALPESTSLGAGRQPVSTKIININNTRYVRIFLMLEDHRGENVKLGYFSIRSSNISDLKMKFLHAHHTSIATRLLGGESHQVTLQRLSGACQGGGCLSRTKAAYEGSHQLMVSSAVTIHQCCAGVNSLVAVIPVMVNFNPRAPMSQVGGESSPRTFYAGRAPLQVSVPVHR
jgi:hypothetical protein